MSLWGILTATQSALTAKNDANTVWRFFVNAPDAIPWFLAATFVVLLVWTFVPRKDIGEQDAASQFISQTAGGAGSSAVGYNAGTVNHYHGVQDAGQPRSNHHAVERASDAVQPDLKAWDRVEEFSLWQTAHLWVGDEPPEAVGPADVTPVFSSIWN